MWEVEGTEDEGVGRAPAEDITKPGAAAGLTPEAAKLLQQPLTRAEAIGLLCTSYLPDVDQDALLARVGLAGYASASGAVDADTEGEGSSDESPAGRRRRRVNSTRPERDPRLVEKIKLLYQQKCQICGLQLETRYSHYSEAAHIQGLEPHTKERTKYPICYAFAPIITFSSTSYFSSSMRAGTCDEAAMGN